MNRKAYMRIIVYHIQKACRMCNENKYSDKPPQSSNISISTTITRDASLYRKQMYECARQRIRGNARIASLLQFPKVVEGWRIW